MKTWATLRPNKHPDRYVGRVPRGTQYKKHELTLFDLKMQFHDVALYQAVIKDGSLEWNLFSDTVVPKFYDINEDIQDSPAEWHMEFEGSVEYPDVTVDSTTQFVPNERKCVFQTGGEGDVTFWALGFPDQDMFAQFSQIFHGYLFENTYQTQLNEDNIQKVRMFIVQPKHTWFLSCIDDADPVGCTYAGIGPSGRRCLICRRDR